MATVAAAATLLLPPFLLHGRVLAEAMFAILGALFLVHSTRARDWSWLRRSWVRIAIAWWAWVVVCTLPHGPATAVQAVVSGHYLLAVAALEHWTLQRPGVRTWFTRLLRWAAWYIALQSLLQFAVGRNLFGYPRGADGELTGPYQNPRAGAPLSRLLFPAILPWASRLLSSKPSHPGRGLGQGPATSALFPTDARKPSPVLHGRGLGEGSKAILLLVAGVGTVVLIGQRMPVLLTGLGLLASALLIPRLRPLLFAAAVAAGLLIAATPVIAPPTFHRLVQKFSAQMEDFRDSHYGLIAARAVIIAEANPLIGVGFDGFRRECPNPAYLHTLEGAPDPGGAAMCVQHPHNFYLQALVEGGVPGLLLFVALAATWLARLLNGLWRNAAHPGHALRTGLFAAALIHLWPIASSTAWTSMPQSGWFFALLGLGLASTQHYINSTTSAPGAHHV